MLRDDEREKLHLSHDLRVQMQLVSGAVQIIQDIAGDDAIVTGKQDITSFISLIQDSTQRMLGMINQVLEEISASEAIQIYNLQEVATCVVQSMRPIARTHGYGIALSVRGNPYIECPRGKLERVLYNLLTNCVKYALPNTDILVEVYEWEGLANLVVQDEGCGLTRAQSDILMFGGCENEASLINECYGLRSIHRLTHEMKGTINVERTASQKNRISLIFPGKSGAA